MATITLDHVDKLYPNGYHAITDANLDIRDGEFVILVGPSGCGKSATLLWSSPCLWASMWLPISAI